MITRRIFTDEPKRTWVVILEAVVTLACMAFIGALIGGAI